MWPSNKYILKFMYICSESARTQIKTLFRSANHWYSASIQHLNSLHRSCSSVEKGSICVLVFSLVTTSYDDEPSWMTMSALSAPHNKSNPSTIHFMSTPKPTVSVHYSAKIYRPYRILSMNLDRFAISKHVLHSRI